MANDTGQPTTFNEGIIGNVSAENIGVGKGAQVNKTTNSTIDPDAFKQLVSSIRELLPDHVFGIKAQPIFQNDADAIAEQANKEPDPYVGKKSSPRADTRQEVGRECATGETKPRIFIGSSSEGLHIAENIQLGLDRDAECTPWNQDFFSIGSSSLETLVAKARTFDYAVLVLTPDDLVRKRGIEGVVPRDNVLFEAGLFVGALGRERTIMVYCRDDQIELPSDLHGITLATFGRRSDGNWHAALGPVCTQIRTMLARSPCGSVSSD